MPQEIDHDAGFEGPCFTARREAQKVAEVSPLYPVHGSDFWARTAARDARHDPVGAATAAQATHEAEIDRLRQESWGLQHERDVAEGRIALLDASLLTAQEDLWASRRLLAQAEEDRAQAERTREAARAECAELLEEVRGLRGSLEWVPWWTYGSDEGREGAPLPNLERP
jgi:septal ring factor EnvC (AmiA/AmiB activator)